MRKTFYLTSLWKIILRKGRTWNRALFLSYECQKKALSQLFRMQFKWHYKVMSYKKSKDKSIKMIFYFYLILVLSSSILHNKLFNEWQIKFSLKCLPCSPISWIHTRSFTPTAIWNGPNDMNDGSTVTSSFRGGSCSN